MYQKREVRRSRVNYRRTPTKGFLSIPLETWLFGVFIAALFFGIPYILGLMAVFIDGCL